MIFIGGGAVSGVGEGRSVGNGSGSCALTAGVQTNTARNSPRQNRIANCRLPIAAFDDVRANADRLGETKIGSRQLAIGNFFTACSFLRPHPIESAAAETATLISLYLSRADWLLHQQRLETSHRTRVLPDILQDNRALRE